MIYTRAIAKLKRGQGHLVAFSLYTFTIIWSKTQTHNPKDQNTSEKLPENQDFIKR